MIFNVTINYLFQDLEGRRRGESRGIINVLLGIYILSCVFLSHECQLKRKLQDHVFRVLHHTIERKKTLHSLRKSCMAGAGDVYFIVTLMGSDRFRLCNDVKKKRYASES